MSGKAEELSGYELSKAAMKICTLGVACDCAHACTFEEDEEGAVTSKCYCHSGFVLTEDQKSCEPTSDAPSTFSVVRVRFTVPPFLFKGFCFIDNACR